MNTRIYSSSGWSVLASALLVSTLFAACSRSVPDTPEKMAASVARSIIMNDKKAFTKHVINRDGAISMFQLMLDSAKTDKVQKTRIPKLKHEISTLQANKNPTLMRVRTKIITSFDTLAAQAKRDGVDLGTAKFGEIKKVNTRTYLNRKQYDIYFTLSAKGKEYLVKLDDVIMVPGRHYLLGRVKWKGKAKQ